MSICFLVGAGAFSQRGLYPKDGDCVIAADGGFIMLNTTGIMPDLLVGDFDSLTQIPPDVPIKRFSPEKDETDLALAFREGMERGYRTFYFYGASGGREDHTFANLQLLGNASKQGCDCRMICPTYDVYAVTNSTLNLPKLKQGTIVSVFCHGNQADGVTLSGLKYPLTSATLTCDEPIGVSNETTGLDASVTVHAGTLFVYVMQ